MLTGIHYNLPEEEYHAIEALSQSGLKEFAKSPLNYQHYIKNGIKESPQMRKGKLRHLCLLEPDVFKEKVAIVDGNRNAAVVKKEIADAEKQGKFVCKTEELEDCKDAVERLKKHTKIKQILDGALHEVSVFWVNKLGIYCKARFDIVNEKQGYIMDFKVTGIEIHRPFKVRNHISDMNYHWQVRFYKNAAEQIFGKKFPFTGWIFNQVDGPFDSIVRTAPDAMLDLAELEMKPHIEYFAKIKESNDWHGLPQDIEDAELPDFRYEIVG